MLKKYETPHYLLYMKTITISTNKINIKKYMPWLPCSRMIIGFSNKLIDFVYIDYTHEWVVLVTLTWNEVHCMDHPYIY